MKVYILFLSIVLLAEANSNLFPTGTENYVFLAPAYKFPRDSDSVNFHWDRFDFYLYEILNEERTCDHQALEVSFETIQRDGRFMVVQIAKVGCNVDRDSLEVAVKKVGDDTLIYRLKDNQCYKATYKWRQQPYEEAAEKYHVQYECTELEEPNSNSKLIKDDVKKVTQPPSPPAQDGTKTTAPKKGDRASHSDELQ